MNPEFILDLLTEYCTAVKFSDKAAETDDFYKGFNIAINRVLNQIEAIREEVRS